MKRLVWLAVLILSLISFPAEASTIPKPGSKCSSQGLSKEYKGKSYTCIKSGKKLIWNKGIPIKVTPKLPIPSPSPTFPTVPKASFIPWSQQFPVETMSEKAFKSFLDWSLEQSQSPRKHQLITQESLKGFKVLEDLQKMDEFTAGIFSQFFKSKSVTVLASEEQWLVSQIISSGGNLRNSQGRCNERYDNFAICMNRDSHFGIVVLSDCSILNHRNSCGVSVLPHEYFHLVQLNLANNIEGAHWNYGDEYAKYTFPHWLVEGSANFVASAITSIRLNGTYSEFRERSLSNFPSGPHMANALIDYEIRTPNQAWDDGLYSYNIGHIATEYLVASVGFKSFLQIWEDFAVTKNFYISFEKVTGISVSDFYSKFEGARQSLRIPPITWKRDGNLQNRIINP